uniref:Uncharacterized protein n=2 Tax=Rhodnius prolixus TaxID=13249 RepID=T1HIB4_RHOPR
MPAISDTNVEAIGNGLLAIVSCFAALKVQKNFPFCLAAFALICINALISFISNVDEDSSVVKLRKEVSRLYYYITIPLIATEMCLSTCVRDIVAYLNLVIPVFDYFLRFSNTEKISVIEMAHFGSLAAILYCTINIKRFIGFAVVCSSLLTNLVAPIKSISQVQTNKFFPYFTILLCWTT